MNKAINFFFQKIPEKLQDFFKKVKSQLCLDRSKCDLCITLVWKNTGSSMNDLLPKMSISPLSASQVITKILFIFMYYFIIEHMYAKLYIGVDILL